MHPPQDVHEGLPPVEGLIILVPRVSEFAVNLINSHHIHVVWRREEEFSTWPRHAVHFPQRALFVWNVFDGFAIDYQFKGVFRERETLYISLNQTGGPPGVPCGQLATCRPQRPNGKIASCYPGPRLLQRTHKSTPPASYLKHP